MNEENLIYRASNEKSVTSHEKISAKMPSRFVIVGGIILLTIVVILGMWIVHSSLHEDDSSDPVIAVIGETHIRLSEYLPFFMSRFQSNWEILTIDEKETLANKYLRELVEIKILNNSLDLLSTEDIQKADNTFVQFVSKALPQYSMQKTSAQREITECEVTERIRNNLLAMKIKQKIIASFHYTITDEELKAYYNEHQQDFYINTSTVHLQQIHFNDAKLGKKVFQNLQNGSTFRKELQALRDNNKETPELVDLGIIELEKLDPAEQKLITPAKVGDYVSFQYGPDGEFSISKILRKRMKGDLPFSDVQTQIRARVIAEKENTIFENWLKQKYTELSVTLYEKKLIKAMMVHHLMITQTFE